MRDRASPPGDRAHHQRDSCRGAGCPRAGARPVRGGGRRGPRAGLDDGLGPVGEPGVVRHCAAGGGEVRAAHCRLVLARWLASATYTRKWLVLGSVIGVIAGLGAVVFFEALRGASYLFLQVIAGYTVPTPVGEGGRAARPHFVRPWAIPLVACLGALVGAILVFGSLPTPRARYRCRDRCGPPQSARDPAADRARQDRRLGADDRLRRLGRSRGADGPDQRRLRLVPGPAV